jgi:hypothetical protein
VGHGILDDESFCALGVRQDHAKTHRAAVVLHVKRVSREPNCFGEMIHGFGDVIEGVCEFFRVWPVTMSEAWVVGRDQVIAIRKAGEKWLEHSRRRGKSMQ